jgi:murein DD-endopeptidase MepM/ murein hydrolase activator NlpD
MRAHRSTACTILFVLAAATTLVVAVCSALAANGVPGRMLFPVVGPVTYTDDFGDPRWQGGHEGNDLVADWRTPVIAVEAGRVVFWIRSASAGCMLYLYGRSGTSYRYVHLNNDLTARNDNRGGCVPGVAFAPGLRDGQDVRAGQLIGYVGDSGDANGIHPHLHFEIHPGDGPAVSPYRYLRRAERLAAATSEPEALDATLPLPTRPRPVA